MCSFECPSIAVLLSHLRLVHSSDPRFLVCCGINSCTVTSRSFSSLYTHVYRHHPGEGIRRRSANSFSVELSSNCESDSHEDTFQSGTGILHDELQDYCVIHYFSLTFVHALFTCSFAESVTTTADIDRLMGYDEELQKRSAALLLLKLKERRRVSQVAIDDVVEHSKAQFDRTVSILLAEVRSHLAEKGVDSSELDLDSSLSKFHHPFLELNTKHKQDKYFRDKLGLIVSRG